MIEKALKVKVVGKRPRPTALVIGSWSKENIAALRLRFPTCWCNTELPHKLSPEDVDYVIAGVDYDQPIHHSYLRQCRLIMIGTTPNEVPPVDFFGYSQSSTIEAAVTDIHPILNDILSNELNQIKSFSHFKILIPIHNNDQGNERAAPDLLPHAYLINSKSRILGFVTNPNHPPFTKSKYKACLQWVPKDLIGCINAIAEYWAHTKPEDHPFHIPWSAQRDWMTPEERLAFDEIERLNREEEATLSRISVERESARQQLQKCRSAAEEGLRKLLHTQGDELVDITIVALKHLGFSVQNMDEIVPAGQRREDLSISHPDFCGETILCEVKGFLRGGGKGSDLGKLRKHIKRYYGENGKKDPYRSWFIINGQFDLPPGQRHAPFHSDIETVRSLEDDDKILVIGTCDLYRLLIDETLTQDKRRQHLLAKEGGVFRWPPPN